MPRSRRGDPRAPSRSSLSRCASTRLARDLEQRLLEPAIDQRHERVGRRVARAQRGEDLLLALAPMLEVVRAARASGSSMTGPCAGSRRAGFSAQHALERREVGGQVALQIRRDLDRRPLDREIAAEQRARLLVPEAQVVRRVPRRVHGAQPVVARLDDLVRRRSAPTATGHRRRARATAS